MGGDGVYQTWCKVAWLMGGCVLAKFGTHVTTCCPKHMWRRSLGVVQTRRQVAHLDRCHQVGLALLQILLIALCDELHSAQGSTQSRRFAAVPRVQLRPACSLAACRRLLQAAANYLR